MIIEEQNSKSLFNPLFSPSLIACIRFKGYKTMIALRFNSSTREPALLIQPRLERRPAPHPATAHEPE